MSFDTDAGRKVCPSKYRARPIFKWVSEILEHKPECFPELYDINILESTRFEPDYAGSREGYEFVLLTRLRRLCEKTDVAVNAIHIEEGPEFRHPWWTEISE